MGCCQSVFAVFPPFSFLKLVVKIKLNLPAFIVVAAIKPLVGNVKVWRHRIEYKVQALD